MRKFEMIGLAAVAAMLAVGAPAVLNDRAHRPLPHQKRYAQERNRKQSRAADRSKKQFLIKGVRP